MLSSEFADVTLVTDDKQQIRAHRNILSACSPVFKNILQIDSNSINPVIYLRGIQHSEMESIMQFIYLGEAKLYEERMNEFIKVSKDLEIKDLSTGIEMNSQTDAIKVDSRVHENDVDDNPTQTFSEDCANDEHRTQMVTRPITRNNAATKKVSRADGVKYACNQCDHQATTQQHLTTHMQSKHEGVKYACNQCDYQATKQQHLTYHIQSKHEGVKYACNQCDYQAGYQSHLTQHIQSKHVGIKYACNQCDLQFTKQSHLTRHIQSKHEGVKYSCNQCDYQATRQDNLIVHIQSQHEGVKYACNQCDYLATTQSHLKTHIRSKHEAICRAGYFDQAY